MKRVAIVFDGNIVNPKGKVNSIINRIRELKAIADFDIDVFTVQEYETTLLRLLLRGKRMNRSERINLGGIDMQVIWHKRYFIDWLLSMKFHRKPFRSLGETRRIAEHFKAYDLIISHSFYCGNIALAAHRLYGVPYVTNWHGSEIHTQPFRNPYQRKLTKVILEHAEMNFFVSKSLGEIATSFAGEIKKDVLYNGVSEKFYQYDSNHKQELRKQYGAGGCKVVAFVGNLISIKNPLLLPEIFAKVKSGYGDNIKFWIVGDGVLRPQLEGEIKRAGLEQLTTFLGNQAFEKMPDIMNCIDVLVLPSQNESFGMVLVEAMACGAYAVGSKVGGIPEILGEENVFELDGNVAQSLSIRIIQLLNNTIINDNCTRFQWKDTANHEVKVVRDIINSRYDSKRS